MKTHKFRLGKYHISEEILEGCTDIPGDPPKLWLTAPPGDSYRAFAVHMHEALHANGCPDSYLHSDGGHDCNEQVARYMWRWLKEKGFKCVE